MNREHNESSAEPSDESIREILAPLQALQPSLEKQTEIRELVAARLTEPANQQSSAFSIKYFTARTLVALACTLLAGVGIGWMLRGLDQGAAQIITTKPHAPASEPEPAAPTETEQSVIVATDDSQPSYYVSETYLCGVGLLNSSSGYTFQENK